MAEEEMVASVSDPFLDAVAKAIRRLDEAQGPLYAAMLAGLSAPDEWVLLVGSKKLAANRFDGIHAIVAALKGRIPRQFAPRIRRVDVLKVDDPTYVVLSRAFQVSDGPRITLNSCDVFGLEVGRAIVFVMNSLGRAGLIDKPPQRTGRKRPPAEKTVRRTSVAKGRSRA